MKRAFVCRSLCLAVLAAAAPLSAAITSVVDSNAGSLGLSFSNLSINAGGLIAFRATTETSNQFGVFTFDPSTSGLGAVATGASNSTVNTQIRALNSLQINDAGTVGFHVTFGGSTVASRPQGVYAGAGSGSVLVLKSGAATSVNAPVPLNNTINFLGIDNTGRAVISGRSSSTTPDTRFVLRGDGSSTLTTILDNTAAYAGVQGGGFYSFGGGVVSATGDAIAFNAVHDPGPSAADTGSYFFNTTTSAISTIQDEDSHPDAEYSFVGTPTQILGDNDVIYQNTGGGNNLRRFRRYDAATGALSDVVDNRGDFDFFGVVDVNDSGQTVFSAQLDPAELEPLSAVAGIYTGLDPIANEVAVTGQQLFGGTLLAAANPVLRPNGDIFFTYAVDTDGNGVADIGGIAKSDAAPSINSWAGSGGGDFLAASNWSDGVAPNGAGVRAKLGSAIAGNSTVQINSAVTLDALSIDNANSYTLAGSGSLNFDGTRYHIIGVQSGSHVIEVPVNVNKNGAINVSTGASLAINSALKLPVDGYFRKNGKGVLQVQNINTAAFEVAAGTVRIAPNSTAAGLSVVNRLEIPFFADALGVGTIAAGQLDLTDNGLIIDYAAGSSSFAEVSALIVAGRNDGNWTGAGITSSTAAANASVTAVGFAEAAAIGATTFFGTTVDADAILVRYTRLGDADLSGTTNISDFARLAANFNGLETTWATGDFNFDGTTDISDFSLLAANFNQSLPGDLPRASVPEPAAISMILLSTISLCRRRTRSR